MGKRDDPWTSAEMAEAQVEKTGDHVHLSEGTGRCIICGVNLPPLFDEWAHRQQALSSFYYGDPAEQRHALHPDQDPCTIDPADPLED